MLPEAFQVTPVDGTQKNLGKVNDLQNNSHVNINAYFSISGPALSHIPLYQI